MSCQAKKNVGLAGYYLLEGRVATYYTHLGMSCQAKKNVGLAGYYLLEGRVA
jgi:hypothetical protein